MNIHYLQSVHILGEFCQSDFLYRFGIEPKRLYVCIEKEPARFET